MKWNTPSPMRTFCDCCLHSNTIGNHYRHSHCLLNLVFTEKYGGTKKQRGWLREKTHPWGQRPVLNTKALAYTGNGSIEKQANLFITSHSDSWIFNNCGVIHPNTEAMVSSSLTRGRNLPWRICFPKVLKVWHSFPWKNYFYIITSSTCFSTVLYS